MFKMSDPWTTHIFAFCKVLWLKQGSVDQMGGTPPIRVIMAVTSKTKSKSTVTLKLMGSAKQKFTKFSGGFCEEVLHHVQLLWNL